MLVWVRYEGGGVIPFLEAFTVGWFSDIADHVIG